MPAKKISKKLPKPIERLQHPILGADLENKDKVPLYVKKKMSPEEYVNMMSGSYGHDWYNLPDEMDKHPHSTPQNNDKIVRRLLSDMEARKNAKSGSKDMVDRMDSRQLLHKLIKDHPVSDKAVSHLISNPEKYEYSTDEVGNAIKEQPNLSSKHIDQLLDENHSPSSLLTHPAFTKEHAAKILSDPSKLEDLDASDVNNLVQNQKHNDPSKRLLDDSQVEQLARKAQNNSISLDRTLEHLDPAKRSKILDDMLGITEGHEAQSREDGSDEDFNYGYQNWIPDGEDYSREKAAMAAESKFLSPHQIDHIKRHGEFAEKYNLFSNPNVDHQHAAEMYENWLNDDTDKGYDLDDLKNKIQEEHPYNDVYEDYMDDAREKAQENYTPKDYISDSNMSDEDIMGQSLEEYTQENPGSQSEDQYHLLANKARQGDWGDLPDRARDSLYEGYDESTRDSEHEYAQDLYDDDKEKFHEDERYLPDHLKGKLPAVEAIKKKRAEEAEVEARKEAEIQEKKNQQHLNAQIPNRDNKHAYGDLQHHVEMVKDFADANGGQIDIGHLNKLYPNLKDKWKQVFAGKGKISSDELKQKLSDLPKTNYDVSYGKWGHNQMQNINGNNESIIRLDHSPESIAPMKADEKTHEVFRKIQDVSQRSGHPTNANTIGWARVDTSNPKHWMIDETQSDFGSGARDYLKEHGKEDEAEAVNTIIAHHKNWREALTNKIIDLARKNGVEKVSTHSPESKAAHTGADNVHSVYKDSYQKVPRSMGFNPSSHDTLPLSDKGQSVFLTSRGGTSTEDLMDMHKDALNTHANMNARHLQAMDMDLPPEEKNAHEELAQHHHEMYKKHHDRLNNLDPTNKLRSFKNPGRYIDAMGDDENEPSLHINSALSMGKKVADEAAEPPIYGFDSALNEQPAMATGHEGHTFNLNPQAFKKTMQEIFDLRKSDIDASVKNKIAITLKSIKDNKEALDQMKQANPNAYAALAKLVQHMVEIFKHKTGEEAEHLVTKLEAQQALEDQQAQMSQKGDPQADPSQGPGVPNQDQPIHGRKLVYAPGSVRQYSAQDARVKDPETGEWKSYGQGLQNPSEGQDG